MKIALDAAAGDKGLNPNLEGALRAAEELGHDILLVGPEEKIRAGLESLGRPASRERLEIVHSPHIVGMDEEPTAACREKQDSSIMTCASFVSRGRADAFVSAGNSGTTMVASLWHLKRLAGVLRPAIAVPLPTFKGMTVLLDGGANVECKPWHILQFATMGSIYVRHVLKIDNPTVGILSTGEEESKGNDLVHESIVLLKHGGLNFYGPIEGNDIPRGTVDIVVCDGFVGNVCLKLFEGAAGLVFDLLKAGIGRNLLRKSGALLMKGAFRAVKKRMSYDEYGGAPLLGVNGTVIICHGKSNSRAIFNALRVAGELVQSRANEQIKKTVAEMKSREELSRIAA